MGHLVKQQVISPPTNKQKKKKKLPLLSVYSYKHLIVLIKIKRTDNVLPSLCIVSG